MKKEGRKKDKNTNSMPSTPEKKKIRGNTSKLIFRGQYYPNPQSRQKPIHFKKENYRLINLDTKCSMFEN